MPLEQLRNRIHRSLDRRLLPLCRVLAGFGVRPNQITLTGALVCLLGAVLVAADQLVLGGLVWLAGSALDMLDGALARSQNQVSRGGAFLDSTLDRISEGALFTAIAYHFAAQGAAARRRTPPRPNPPSTRGPGGGRHSGRKRSARRPGLPQRSRRKSWTFGAGSGPIWRRAAF